MNTVAQALVEHEPESVALAPVSESAAIFQIIERAARDPNVDIDKMQRLMDMRERELNRLAQVAFNAAMSLAQAEMKPIVRDADNEQTKSMYARYETISDAIQPIITKHGFALTFSEGETPKANHIRSICDVMHREGHTKQYYADVPFDNVGMRGNANKTNTHAYGSTKSYGKRYLKCDIFDVALKNADDDGNKAGTSTITEEQRDTLLDLIAEVGAHVPKFCEIYQIEAVADLPAKLFADAVQALRDYGEKQKAAKK